MQIPQNISDHEKSILYMLSQGMQNKCIANALCLSEHTIKNHKANLCRKLSLSSTTELYVWASQCATMLQTLGGGGKFQFKPLVNFTKFSVSEKISKMYYCKNKY